MAQKLKGVNESFRDENSLNEIHKTNFAIEKYCG